jgi:hypothetical protein
MCHVEGTRIRKRVSIIHAFASSGAPGLRDRVTVTSMGQVTVWGFPSCQSLTHKNHLD